MELFYLIAWSFVHLTSALPRNILYFLCTTLTLKGLLMHMVCETNLILYYFLDFPCKSEWSESLEWFEFFFPNRIIFACHEVRRSAHILPCYISVPRLFTGYACLVILFQLKTCWAPRLSESEPPPHYPLYINCVFRLASLGAVLIF